MKRASSGSRGGVRWGQVLFDALLRMYPANFARRYGDDIREVFNARLERARTRGRFPSAVVVVTECLKLVPSIVRVRWAAFSSRFPVASEGFDPIVGREESGDMLSSIWQDLRLSTRAMRRAPMHAAAVVLTLGLAIGANTAVFSITRGVILEPFSMPDPDRLVIVSERTNESSFLPLSFESYRDYAAAGTALEHVAAFSDQSMNITGGDHPERLRGAFVTASYFAVVGQRPELGSALSTEHDPVGGAKGVVVSHGVWLNRYGADPNVVGRSLTINGEPHVIVGVMPAEYRDPWFRTSDVWVSMSSYPGPRDRRSASFFAIARLADAATIEQAGEELEALSQRLAEAHPGEIDADRTARVLPMLETVVGGSRTQLRILFGAVALVLLLAVVNVANLQLVRASDRYHEMAVRTTLGGSRRRLVRQLLTESLTLAALGGLLGLLLARVGVDVALRFGPGWSAWRVRIDAAVMAFSIGLTLVTGVLFGLVPAIRVSRASPGTMLRGRSETGAKRGRRIGLRDTLVAVQIALAMVLMVDAGLLIRTVASLDDVDVGFDRDELITMQFRLPAVQYDTDEKVAGFFRDVLDRVRRVPGVVGVATGYGLPFTGDRILTSVRPVGGAPIPEDRSDLADVNIVSADYFEVLGIPVLRGRVFGPQDRAGSEPVAVVSERLAERLFPGGDALGRTVEVFDEAEDMPSPWTIVGVVGDVRIAALQDDVNPLLYVVHAQRPAGFATIAVRTEGPPLSYAQAVQSAVWSLDPDQPLWEVMTQRERVEGRTVDTRFLTMLLVLFAGLAAALAATGTAGVVGHRVGRRTREIGLRVALGARPGEILRGVLHNGLAALAVGLVVGTAAAALSSRLLDSSLFGVARLDVSTFLTVPVLLVVVTALAIWAPARRAATIDPVVALRGE